MGNEIDHGSRLSERDYERQIVDLYSRTPEHAANDTDEALRRRTLDLTIDFRLGREFPATRRDALWKIHTAVEEHRVRMMFSWRCMPFHFPGCIAGLTAWPGIWWRNMRRCSPKRNSHYFSI